MIISHLYQKEEPPFDWIIQSNEEHCLGVASIASGYASEFGMGNWGKFLGLLHDRGKEKIDFQNYIKFKSGYSPHQLKWNDHSHSSIGAILTHQKYPDKFYVMTNIIAGHHRGLYDVDELKPILEKRLPAEINPAIPSINLDRPTFRIESQDMHHLVRMLYSCLVDADFLDTEAFMQHEKSEKRNTGDNFAHLLNKLNEHLLRLSESSAGSINLLRRKIQDKCVEQSRGDRGFYTLSVPTGGGKTLASVLWALHHAIHNSMHRLVIAIPYTSIIVQTAQVLRNIFGANNVLEHHSVLDENNVSEENKLAIENWDAPIVVTTNVQLFESMFSNKPGACRKLHSLCNSVVILDEVQSLPITFLQPICDAMQSYSKMFGTSFLFCTASQPIMDGDHKGLGKSVFHGITEGVSRNLIPNDFKLHDQLRRVKVEFERESRSAEEIASVLTRHNKVLCIVNSRKLAKKIFDSMVNDDPSCNVHLSRMMCPVHIRKTIEYVKMTLKESPNKKMRVVSTQLIEAGVDVDFPTVYRQFSGLDSILQAAGRCNREGIEKHGVTHVFSIDGHVDFGGVRFASDAMKSLLNLMPDADWFSPETMEKYFRILYSKTPSFDRNGIAEMYGNPHNIRYEEIAKNSKLINDPGISVIVNFEESLKLIEKLKYAGPSRKLIRELGLYSVSVSKRMFDEFCKMGIIETVMDGIYYIPLKEQYDLVTGLKTDNEYLEQSYII